ncbi:hypothetical protein [Photobacterium sp. Hal280]|uniref:hypothetical protein n=1 Tax=Photobacterium sp. Hal280 TaxID=3035163 RepID=UPI00301D219D
MSDKKSNKYLKLIGLAIFLSAIVAHYINKSSSSRSFGNVSEVCNFLSSQGIDTHMSKNPDVTRSICFSNYVELDSSDSDALANNIAYYVMGKGSQIEKLKVVVNFNQPPSSYTEDTALKAFQTLISKSLGVDSLPQLEDAIKNRKSMNWSATTPDQKKVADIKLVYDKWPTTGYEFRFIIE